MNDMSSTIVAKSDQINAADLIGSSRTVTIREVRIKAGDDQPVTILIEGDDKGFRPCKGVRRLLVRVWGPDANKYIGQSMTLFCDPKVTWAGKEEGGIRVSHMTGLREKIVEYMRTSRAATKPYEILPLKVEEQSDPARKWADGFVAKVGKAVNVGELDILQDHKNLAGLRENRPELHAECLHALDLKREAFATDNHREGRDDSQLSEGFGEDPGGDE